MQINIQAVTKECKTTSKGDVYWGIKVGDKWMNLAQNNKPNKGQMEAEVRETNYGTWARPIGNGQTQTPPQQAQVAPGAIKWADYIATMRVAHAEALQLEPDDQGEHVCERSVARCNLVQTVLVALRDGKLQLPPTEPPEFGPPPGPDDEPPPPDDDQIPF